MRIPSEGQRFNIGEGDNLSKFEVIKSRGTTIKAKLINGKQLKDAYIFKFLETRYKIFKINGKTFSAFAI